MARLRPVFLLAAAAAAAGCRGGAQIESFAADTVRGRPGRQLTATFVLGRHTASLELQSGLLTADVLTVVHDYRRPAVTLEVELHNRSDEPLAIRVEHVFLDLPGGPVGAKLPRDVELPPLRPRTRQRVHLDFELDAPVAAGIYPLRIERVQPLDSGMAIDVRVPGELRAAAPQ